MNKFWHGKEGHLQLVWELKGTNLIYTHKSERISLDSDKNDLVKLP